MKCPYGDGNDIILKGFKPLIIIKTQIANVLQLKSIVKNFPIAACHDIQMHFLSHQIWVSKQRTKTFSQNILKDTWLKEVPIPVQVSN